jgi:spore coat polysaccharide biosynthesis protein SpsF (cytidylyltransferase family)/aryl-alcohol dehydrogenase-like predicted oxidoreductase
MSKYENALVIVQARSSSERLPGKVLLPIKGIPSVCLSALRAGNTGLEVLVATSEDNSDNELERVLNTFLIPCFRGSLNNVHDRFRSILLSRPKCEIVVRLTADNVFPDGCFIEKMISEFLSSGAKYLISDMRSMPYGLSGEVFTRKVFLEENPSSLSESDREHVTTKLRLKFPGNLFSRNEYTTAIPLRCTIDYHKDYEKISALFDSIDDPVGADASRLVESLKQGLTSPARFSLGTVQLGLDYGINNTTGRPTLAESYEILASAHQGGIRHLDTARAYGDSEKIIGSFSKTHNTKFSVCTKLSPDLDTSTEKKFLLSIRKSLEESVVALDTVSPLAVLFHRTEHLESFDGAGYHYALELIGEFKIRNLGVSISSPCDLSILKKFTQLKHLQIPFNILDHRWQYEIDSLQSFNLTGKVQTRSIFLQGLLLMDPNLFPGWLPHGEELKQFLLRLRRQGPLYQSLMEFVVSESWIDEIIVGAESLTQINELLESQKKLDVLSFEQKNEIIESRPLLTDAILNPANWKKQ